MRLERRDSRLSETERNPKGSVRPLPLDPWAWLTAVAVLPLVWFTRGTPRGEPVAEDFDFLRRAVLEGGGSWFDGGGSLAFWRPVSHQLYYRVFGEMILEHPARIATLHVACLAIAALLLYRVFRRPWSGSRAFAAASFPLLAESTRTLVCWPSHFVDLGAFLFLSLALHEAAHRRAWSAAPAMLAALFCKELALIGVLLVPFVPGVFAGRRAERLRWIGICAGLGLAWSVAYLAVRRAAGLELPHALEHSPAVIATPILARLEWAVGNCLRAAFSLPRAPHLGATFAVAMLVLATSALVIVRSSAARARFAAARGWVAWGATWCLLSWMAVASIFPFWAPNRSQLGSVGLAAGAVGLAAAVHPAGPAVLVAARLGLLAAGPRTPAGISAVPEDRGAFMDYPKLSRLQQLMAAARRALRDRYPTLPRGASIAWHDLPLSAEYAFGGALAMQAWYRDTTLRVMKLQDALAESSPRTRVFLTYQPRYRPEVVVIDEPAERARAEAFDLLRDDQWTAAIDALDRASSRQQDRSAYIFLGEMSGRRAYCLAQLGRWEEADRGARFALAMAAEDVGARYVVAAAHAMRREYAAALAQLDTLLAISPKHDDAIRTRDALIALTRNASATTNRGVHPARRR